MQEDATTYEYCRDLYIGLPHCCALGFRFHSGQFRSSQIIAVDWREDLVGNPTTGSVHPAVTSTLIDTAGAVAVAAQMTELSGLATLDLRIDFLKQPEAHQTIYAKAYCYDASVEVFFVRIRCFQQQENIPFALGTSTYMKIKKR